MLKFFGFAPNKLHNIFDVALNIAEYDFSAYIFW